ncbi:MAG: antibiotic biosynthesis monooxygenase [Pseudonocardia sp.]|nr:antibiotic biosynthesis monooxygenase [Pseudonocardia sp.]
MLLVCRFIVPTAQAPAFAARARRALELLGAAPGCRGGEAGRAVDDPQRWVLTLRFDSVDAYRRALSPFPVREHVVPLLSEALPEEPSTYETLLVGTDGAVEERVSLLAEGPEQHSR